MKIVLATLIAFGLAATLVAQAPPPPQQRPTFRAGVNLVRVDVYPTLDGRAVSDLTRDDFEVREDGVLQRLETFERIVASAPSLEIDRAEPRSQAEADAAAGDPRNRLFVVFYDTLHTVGYKAGEGRGGYDPRTAGVALSDFLLKL